MHAREIERGEVLVVEERVEQRVDAGQDGERRPAQRLDEGRNVARIGDHEIGRADHQGHEAVHLQREHVIERQGGDERFAVGLERRRDPCVDLAQVGDHVAMGQHRALGHAGGSAGVLKKGDVVGLDGRVGERAPRAQGQRAIEAHGVGQMKGGNGAPDVAQRRIDQRALDAAQLIASAGDDHEFERRPVVRLLDRGGEVLKDDDRLRAGIGKLVLELARRVERVAVDDHIAGAQGAERGDRILQQVRRHQRDAGAPRQAGDVFEVASRKRAISGRVRHRKSPCPC